MHLIIYPLDEDIPLPAESEAKEPQMPQKYNACKDLKIFLILRVWLGSRLHLEAPNFHINFAIRLFILLVRLGCGITSHLMFFRRGIVGYLWGSAI